MVVEAAVTSSGTHGVLVMLVLVDGSGNLFGVFHQVLDDFGIVFVVA